MICVRCDQSVAYEVTNRHYGVATSRCGCGVQKIVPVVIEPVQKGSLAHLMEGEAVNDRIAGYTLIVDGKRRFYGTCKMCQAEFESTYPRKTCHTPSCRKASKIVNDPMMAAVCPFCKAEFQTRVAMPRDRCKPCYQITVVSPRKIQERARGRTVQKA